MNISGPKPNSQHVLGLLKCLNGCLEPFRKFIHFCTVTLIVIDNCVVILVRGDFFNWASA